MIKKRIIPCLDIEKGRVVKGCQFVDIVDAGDPITLARAYEGQGADELVFLDIKASYENRSIILDMVRSVAEEVFIPFTVGGGVRTVEDIKMLLNSGADKVAVNTNAISNPDLIREASNIFGSQCIVVAIDAKKRANGWEVYTHGGRIPTDKDVIKWAVMCQNLGAGEILLTSIDSDGRKHGYDISLTRAVRNAVSIPVIASGGVGDKEDFYEVFIAGKVDAALAASVFHFGKYTVKDVKQYLKNRGVPIR